MRAILFALCLGLPVAAMADSIVDLRQPASPTNDLSKVVLQTPANVTQSCWNPPAFVRNAVGSGILVKLVARGANNTGPFEVQYARMPADGGLAKVVIVTTATPDNPTAPNSFKSADGKFEMDFITGTLKDARNDPALAVENDVNEVQMTCFTPIPSVDQVF